MTIKIDIFTYTLTTTKTGRINIHCGDDGLYLGYMDRDWSGKLRVSVPMTGSTADAIPQGHIGRLIEAAS